MASRNTSVMNVRNCEHEHVYVSELHGYHSTCLIEYEN